MRFPTGTEVFRLRTRHGQRSRVYLGVQRGKERTDAPPPLMVGQHYQLVAADAYDAVNEYTLTFTTANFLRNSDIRPNMTLAVGTLADPFLRGSARIRLVDANNNRLCLEPNNLGAEGYLVEGDYIWVDGVYRLYRKLPYIVDGVVYEDGNPDTALAAAGIPGYGIAWAREWYYRPVALMGSPRPAFAGEPINFYGWRSHGRGTRRVRYCTWDFDGGVCEGPGLTYAGSPANPVLARWDAAGEYVASLLVRDNSGDAAPDAYGVRFDEHRAVRPVLVFDRPGRGDNPPYTDFEVASLAGRYGSGWSCRITVYGTANKSEFPDNALIILFAEDWHAGVRGSIGGWYGQENILFVGHIRADSVEVDSEKSAVSFEAQTIEQWMKDISIWPANFSDPGGGADAWHEFNNMVVEDTLWHLAEIHSNLKDVTDCFFASDVGAEKEVGFLDLTEASLYDQMSSQIGSCFFGQLSASRHGSVHLSKHKNMLELAERAWWGPPVYSFSKQDWRDELEIGEERQRDSVAQVDFIGFVYDANGNPLEVYSLAPARQTNFGGIEKVSGILLSGNSIATGQAENNTLAGLYRAWKNIRFPHIRMPAFNNRILEPATLDYFAVVLEETDTERGYDWGGKEFLCTGISLGVDSEDGIVLADIEGEASTWGPEGVAGPYPDDPPAGDPPEDNPPEYWPDWQYQVTSDPPPWAEDPDGDGDGLPGMTVYLGLTSGHLIRGTGLGPGRGYSCSYHNCGLVHTDGIRWVALDEFDSDNSAMIVTTFNLYRTRNLNSDSPNFELVLNSTWPISMVRSSPLRKDLWVAIGVSNVDVLIWVSYDGGDNWSQRTFTSGDADAIEPIFLELSTHDWQRGWATWVDNAENITYIARTENLFANVSMWSSGCFDGDPSQGRPCCHHRTYDNDHDDDVAAAVYGGAYINATDYARAWVNGTCSNLYSDAAAPDDVGVRQVGCGVDTRNRWWALAYSPTVYGFWVSDGGVWTEQYTWDIAVGAFFWGLSDGHNYREDWRWYALTRDGTSYPVTITVNRGETWSPQWGNWPAFTTDEGLGDPDPICVCSSRLVP